MPADECLKTPECFDAYASVHYIPSMAGNALFLGIFGAVLITQIWQGIKYKTWGYLVAMIGGTVLEIVGYYGRIGMNTDPFNGKLCRREVADGGTDLKQGTTSSFTSLA